MPQTLTPVQTRALFFSALLLFVLPFILVDFPYVDDNWRIQLENGPEWRQQGRVLTEVFYRLLTFSGSTLNLFPLPLLIACAAAAWALTDLARHCFGAPRPTQCLALLPLWFSPFWLGNLTYQYDGPTMALSLVAVIYAAIFRSRHTVLALLMPAALLPAAIAFYQVALNVFVGLCCLELIRAVQRREAPTQALRLVVRQGLQLLLGGVLYYLTAYQLMATTRHAGVGGQLLPELWHRLGEVLHSVGLLVTPGNLWLWWLFGGLAAIGYGLGGLTYARAYGRRALLPLLLYGATLPVLAACVAGITLLFSDFILEARTLMGLAVILTLALLLAHDLLERLQPRLTWLLVLPVLWMLSLAYAYGQVLSAQKTFERGFVQELHHDLSSLPELRPLKRLLWTGGPLEVAWLPLAQKTFEQVPVLPFILGLSPGNFMIAERLLDLGAIDDADSDSCTQRVAVPGAATRLVDNRFYDIWAVGEDGCIIMKPQRPWVPFE